MSDDWLSADVGLLVDQLIRALEANLELRRRLRVYVSGGLPVPVDGAGPVSGKAF